MSNQTQTHTLETVQAFLSVKRLAMIGLSRDPKHFSATLFSELIRRGYDVLPVNPRATDVLGHPCFVRVQDIQPPVEAALLMTSSDVTDSVVADCAKAGIRRIWLYSAGHGGASTPSAVAFCKARGIEVIAGECPFMFFPHNGFHAIHGLVNKIIGRYPKPTAA